MSSKNVINKIKAGIFAVLMLSSGVKPVFASEEYPGHDYPWQLYGMPVFSITRIDLTNNQLEFSMNEVGLYGKVLKNFGAGWITDHSAGVENMDLRAYESVSNVWSQRVFWSDDNDLSSYISYDDGSWKKYTVDAEVDLRSNTTYRLFYIAEFEDGDKWISRISYEDCASAWTEGMSCDSNGYISGSLNYDHTKFNLVAAPIKATTELDQPVAEEPAAEEPIQEPASEPELTPEPTLEVAATETTAEQPEMKTDNVEAATVKTVESVMVLEGDTEEIDEEADDEADDEEIDLSPEGPGETTLTVPTLGKTEVIGFNWLPYFIGGAVVGGGLTWFLVYLNNKRKLPFLR